MADHHSSSFHWCTKPLGYPGKLKTCHSQTPWHSSGQCVMFLDICTSPMTSWEHCMKRHLIQVTKKMRMKLIQVTINQEEGWIYN